MQPNKPVVVTPTKNIGLAIFLTIVFGPLGMLYSTIPGAIVMCLASGVAFIAGIATFGLSLILLVPLLWIISIFWAAGAASAYNRRLSSQ